MTTLTFEDKAYLAGFLDGEGCFYATDKGKIHVRCSNTDKTALNLLQAAFGGSMRADTKRKSHHQQCYSWSVVSRDAERLCSVLTPFLRQKREQALMLIAIQQMAGTQGVRPTQETRKERVRFAQMLKDSKHVTTT